MPGYRVQAWGGSADRRAGGSSPVPKLGGSGGPVWRQLLSRSIGDTMKASPIHVDSKHLTRSCRHPAPGVNRAKTMDCPFGDYDGRRTPLSAPVTSASASVSTSHPSSEGCSSVA